MIVAGLELTMYETMLQPVALPRVELESGPPLDE